MDTARISALLQPFLLSPLSGDQLASISAYIDLLLRWNARINLTAVRQEEYIVTRHFGESLFAARHLFPAGQNEATQHLVDVGSGAGFPGLPIKIWNPGLRLTLIDSNHKKATFLRELVRILELTNVEVFAGRAEDYPGQAGIVTIRAVEKFEQSLPVAAHLLNSPDPRDNGRPGSLPRVESKGLPSAANEQTENCDSLSPASFASARGDLPHGARLALLIGEAQCQKAHELAPSLLWDDPTPIPLSVSRILLVGTATQRRHESA